METATRTSNSNSIPPPKRGPKDFIFGRVLGEGSFSTVYLAKDIYTGKEFAIKVCEKHHIFRERKQEYIHREKEVLNLLSSTVKTSTPFFVRLFFTFQDETSLYFGLTYAPGGDLLTYLQKVVKFDLDVTRFYAAEIVHATEHMHMLGIVHRDLKPENILLSKDKHILITDFGSSKLLPRPPLPPDGELREGAPRRSSFVGTAQYVSPEILTDKKSSPASDLWAIGCIIYQMVEGQPPFQGRSEYAIFQKILKLEFKYPLGFPAVVTDLISKLLVIDSKQRLGAQDIGGYASIKEHEFFKSIDFESLHLKTPPRPSGYTDSDDELAPTSHSPEFQGVEPGLGGQQLSRLLGFQLNDDSILVNSTSETKPPETKLSETAVKSPLPTAATVSTAITTTLPAKVVQSKRTLLNIPATEEQLDLRLKHQQENLSQWHHIVEKKLILKQGLIDKRKGLFSRRRMLLLTLGPSMYYVDPTNMVLKGQIPFGSKLRAEAKNFKNFHVHTPGRTYYLEDPEGFALEWCKALEEVRKHYFEK